MAKDLWQTAQHVSASVVDRRRVMELFAADDQEKQAKIACVPGGF